MRIGIICAIPNELRYFNLSENLIQKIGERKFYKGTHDKHELILVQSGLGKVNAAVASTLLIEKFKCEFLLFSGVAGGIDPRIEIGEVIIGDSLIQYDYGTLKNKEIQPFRPGNIPTGKSKNEIRKMFISESKLNNFKFSGLLIPNVFGPFSKPNHNTFIATFCNKIINGKISEIIKDSLIPLIYIDDLILEIINEINNVTNNKKLINPEIKIKVSEVLNLIKLFNKTYIKSHKLPDIKNKFSENLFNTFLSFIKKEDYYPVYLKNKIDERGGFFEIIREESGGQTSISYTFPNIIRGNHFHTKKIERFCVVKGEALIKIRKLGESNVIKFTVSGSKPSFIDIPIWHTHSIENIGKDELVTVFWINQHFDEKNSDTFSEIV